MEWQSGRRSDNVEDRRGGGGFGGMPGGFGRGGGIRIGRAAGGGGIGIVVIALIMLFMGVDPSVILQGGGSALQPGGMQTSEPIDPARESEMKDFVSVVLASTEDTWTPIFQQHGWTYQAPPLVLFDGGVDSGCGPAQSAMGPFYCPEDHKVYLDLAFFDELKQRFGAPGEFARAYVVAHEVGHHVQNLLGILPKVNQYRQQAAQADANHASVMVELQADCFAGVWAAQAHRAGVLAKKGITLDQQDIQDGLNAAEKIGDDMMMRRAGRGISEESFTHGSSEQRYRWFRTGMEQGSIEACDTFNAAEL